MPVERLDAFMARANAAYYATHDPFRDFTTSPEITQVFGELLGAWCAVVWQQMGSPDPVLLIECGPGRGTLLQDAMRGVARVAPHFHQAARLHLVETSPRLRAAQEARLPGATWHDSLATLPDGPAILLANEFLDALPIRQFVRTGPAWAERHVAAGAFVDHPATPPIPTPPEAADGTVIEWGEAAQSWLATLATRLLAQGGTALLLDYGPAASAPGDSLQALRDGQPTSPLTHPGDADLTAHVDFAALAETARTLGAAVHGPVPQGPFLASLGLFHRTMALARTQGPARAARLVHAAQRLAEPDRMGALFKAMAVCQPGAPTPPGFEA